MNDTLVAKTSEKESLVKILQTIKLSRNDFETKIHKNYEEKIKKKLFATNAPEKSADINNLVIFLNYCFLTKNDFFVVDFNRKMTNPVNQLYNKIKTNILDTEIFYDNVIGFFSNIDLRSITLLKYILKKYKVNYTLIANYAPELCQIFKPDSVDNVIQYLDEYSKTL